MMTLVLTQDSGGGNTLTLPASVVNAADVEAAFDLTANAVNVLTVFSYDGGVTWFAFLAGGSGGASALDDLSDVTITTPEADQQLQYVGGTWVNNHRRWEPVITDTGSGPELVFTSGDIVMTWADYS